MLAFGDWPTEGESAGTDVEAQVIGEVADFLGPFVEGETAGAAVVVRDAEDQVGRGYAISNGVENACADAENAVIVDEHRVVVPEGAVRRDALVASVGDCGSEAGNFGSGGWRGQDDPFSEISGQLGKVGDVGEAAPEFGEYLEEGWGAAATKNHANGDNQKFHEDVGKNNGQVGVVDEAAKRGTDVVDMLEYVLQRVVDAEVPDLKEVPHEGRAKVNAWIFVVAIRRAGLGDVTVRGAEVEGGERRGAVDDQPSFSFPQDPGDGRDEEAVYKESQATRQEQMVGECLLLDELLPDVHFVFGERRVVVVVNSRVRVGAWAFKDAGCWNPFGTDAVAEVYVNRGVAVGCWEVTQGVEGGESAVPIAVRGRVLSAEPSDQVAVVEVKGDESLTEKFGALMDREGCVVWVIPGKAEYVNGRPRELEPEDGVWFEWWDGSGE